MALLRHNPGQVEVARLDIGTWSILLTNCTAVSLSNLFHSPSQATIINLQHTASNSLLKGT